MTVGLVKQALAEGGGEPLFNVLRASYDDDLEDEFDGLDDQYIDATEGAENLQQDVVIAISKLPFGLAKGLTPELLTFFEADPEFYELAKALLAITFPLVSGKTTTRSKLQCSVLAAFHANEVIWKCDAKFADYLMQRGLPGTRKEIKVLLD